jgi:cell division protein FtsB
VLKDELFDGMQQTENIKVDKNSVHPLLKRRGRGLLILRNKYLLAIVAFLVWMFFFDRNDLLSQFERVSHSNELKKMEEKKGLEITDTRKELDLLKTNAQTIEKYAREKYLMKKDNEDLFIVAPGSSTK